jgi:MoaA/NifB/PqqE/SkfB family radical SAM enzyme
MTGRRRAPGRREQVAGVVTIDFHVTSECSQECPYCWGPQGFEAVDTETARAIVRKIASTARRVVFTGGDPVRRPDIGDLIVEARRAGLEVALSTTGDELTAAFLHRFGHGIDLVSLPLDGASEVVSSRTKKAGHFTAVMRALDLLARHPAIDVKVATPVTRLNLEDVPAIVALLDERAARTPNRFFYNVFQAYPRAMAEVDWSALVVSDAEFGAVRSAVSASEHAVRINWLTHETLDRLYVMVFPDGTLTVPAGADYLSYGPFLEIGDLAGLLARTDFDAPKHRRHARGWGRTG